jgi:hypothetical protein
MIRLPLACAALAGALVWVAAPAAAQDPKTGISAQTQKINELIAKGWESAGVKKPADRATDHEFLRRAYIDLIGRIATPEEVIDFERDKSADRRAKLVARLLYEAKYTPKDLNGKPVTTIPGLKVPIDYTDDYADHWANIWTVWLMSRTANQKYRTQINFWLYQQFYKGTASHKDMVVKLLTVTGKTGEDRPERGGHRDVNATNFIIYHLGEPVPANEKGKFGNFDAVPITSRVSRLFLGVQTQCIQCHDHPFNKEWAQGDFWGMNAFFRQTVRSATPTPTPMNRNQQMAPAIDITLSDDPALNPDLIVLYERRDGKRMASFPVMLKNLAQAEKGELSTKRLAGTPAGKTRREVLAEWVVGHDNFAKAYVNRIWGHFFGRGLNKEPSVDDFGSHNEVVHPELLAYLAEEFVKYNYDPKKLMEWIATSDAYQLSHVAHKESADPKYDPYFARMPLKAMSPEVLFGSLMLATRAEGRADSEQRKALREAWMQKLVRNFGDDEGNELNFNGTIVQALLMMNGTELNSEIGVGRNQNQRNVVAEVVLKHGGRPAAIYDELFLMTLNRHPTREELLKLEQVRAGAAKVAVGTPPPPAKGKGKGPRQPAGQTVVAPGAMPADVAFYQDVLWALLNTNEFMLNH